MKNHWNFRIVKRGEVFGICEIHYENEKPSLWSSNYISINGESLEDLKTVHERIGLAFSKPILEEIGNTLNEVNADK